MLSTPNSFGEKYKIGIEPVPNVARTAKKVIDAYELEKAVAHLQRVAENLEQNPNPFLGMHAETIKTVAAALQSCIKEVEVS